MNRRAFFGTAAAAAGAAAAAPLLAGCGQSGASGTGTTSASQIAKIMPSYVPSNLIKPQYASVDGSSPGFITYPTNAGAHGARHPWRRRQLHRDHPAVGLDPVAQRQHLLLGGEQGARRHASPCSRPTANTYNNDPAAAVLGQQTAGLDPDPDVLDRAAELRPGGRGQARRPDPVPGRGQGQAVPEPGRDCSPAPGRPASGTTRSTASRCSPPSSPSAGYLYYRADILDQLGIGTPQIKNIDDLFNLGKEINDPKNKRWAFDDIWTALLQPFDIPPNPPNWATNDKGDLLAAWETPNIIEAMNWEAKVVKAGLMNPDAIAQDTNSAKQRFWSGQELITFDGQGAWLGADTQSGQAANKSYVRMAFPFFTASGSGTPRIALANGTEWFSYLNKNLSKGQIEEMLRIANYLAAPFGSYEYTLVTFGAPATDYTMTHRRPGADRDREQAGGADLLVPRLAQPGAQQPGLRRDHPVPGDLRAAQRQVRLQAAVLRHEHLAASQPEQRDGRTHVHGQHREHHPGGGPRPEHDRRLPVGGQGVAAQRRQRAAQVLRRLSAPSTATRSRARMSATTTRPERPGPGGQAPGTARPRPARRAGRSRGGSSCAATGR